MIRLYYMNLSSDCSQEQSLALYDNLTKERKGRIDRLRNRQSAAKQIQAGALLQWVLSKETGIGRKELCFQYGKQGKPILDYETMARQGCICKPLSFNLSHSGDYAVVAVSDREVGVDIEYKKKNALLVAKRCFTEREYKTILEAGDAQEQELCFLQYWTLKEAYIKHSGKGLSTPLNSFEIVRQTDRLFFTDVKTTWFYTMWLRDTPYCISVCSKDYENICKLQIIEVLLSELYGEV